MHLYGWEARGLKITREDQTFLPRELGPPSLIQLNGFFTLFLGKTRRLEECNNIRNSNNSYVIKLPRSLPL
jgi:hypothetical protein